MTTAASGLIVPASGTRVPTAVIVSLSLHIGAVAAWLHHTKASEEAPMSVITNVDILLAQQQPEVKRALERRPPPSMKDFLKMALPAVPKSRAPMDIHAPELKRDLMKIPEMKLEDRGRLKEAAKMDNLDLSRKRADLAKVAEPLVEARQSRAMDMPKLEEIGTRRAAPKVLEMAALQEENRARMGPQGLSAMAPDMERRRAPAAAAMLPSEASAGRPSALSKFADMMTSDANQVRLEPRAMSVKSADTLGQVAPAAPKKQELAEVKKKSVEIEGPLAKRKITSYSVPAYPQWARDQNILEAEVSIRFYVDAAGKVLEDMRVERTSGFGRLDRLAMDSLKNWRFEPLGIGAGNQWGIITFRFVLE